MRTSVKWWIIGKFILVIFVTLKVSLVIFFYDYNIQPWLLCKTHIVNANRKSFKSMSYRGGTLRILKIEKL